MAMLHISKDESAERVIALLRDTVTLICKTSLSYNSELSVEGVIGVKLDQNDMFLVNINELVRTESAAIKKQAKKREADSSKSQTEDVTTVLSSSEESSDNEYSCARRKRKKLRLQSEIATRDDTFSNQSHTTTNATQVHPEGSGVDSLDQSQTLSQYPCTVDALLNSNPLESSTVDSPLKSHTFTHGTTDSHTGQISEDFTAVTVKQEPGGAILDHISHQYPIPGSIMPSATTTEPVPSTSTLGIPQVRPFLF